MFHSFLPSEQYYRGFVRVSAHIFPTALTTNAIEDLLTARENFLLLQSSQQYCDIIRTGLYLISKRLNHSQKVVYQ